MKRLHIINPVDIVELDPGTNVREFVPTEADYIRILKMVYELNLPPYIQWLLIAVWETGLRIGEILALKWEDINLHRGVGDDVPTFMVTFSKQKRMTKRVLPTSFNFWKMLKEIPGEHKEGFVFPVRNPPHHLLRRCELLKSVNLGYLRPFHDFRKSWKTRMKAKGYSSELTKALQGYATDSMDEYYSKLRTEHLVCVVRDTWENEIL